MKTFNKVLTVSILAITAVTGANAVIVSETMLSKTAGVYDKDKTVEMAIADAKKAGTDAATAAAEAQTTANKAVVANAAITAGTGTKITYDAKGLVTGSTTLAASDIPTLTTAKISGLDTALAAKQTTGNMVTAESGTTYDKTSTTTYPSMKTAAKIASEAASAAVSGAAGDYVPTSRKVNNKALSADISLTASDVGAVPTSRKVNGKALSSDVTLAASDVGAVASTQTTKGGILTTNATSGAVEVSSTIASSKVSGLGSLATKSAVASADITDGTIENGDIKDATITNAKLANIATTEDDTPANENNLVTVGIAYDIANVAAGTVVRQNAATFQKSADSEVKTAGNYIEIGNNVASNLAKLDTATKAAKDAADAKQVKLSSADGGNVTITSNNASASGVVKTITATDGTVSVVRGTIAAGDIASNAITNAKVSSSAAITTNKMGAITGYTKATTNADLTTADTLNTALGKLEKKADDAATAAANAKNSVTASGSNGVSASASNGAITVAGTNATTSAKGVVQVGTNISVSEGTISVANAGASTKGVMKLQTTTGTGTDGTMTQKAITDALATKQNSLPAIPATPSTEGVYVLTAKVADNATTYYWEDIGR
ncbi:MAG: hypothetical protein IJ866_02690 [Alphaproteobacteria bacterium]|nr:hypothetical protein [Alphaproteobacteria bacterium]